MKRRPVTNTAKTYGDEFFRPIVEEAERHGNPDFGGVTKKRNPTIASIPNEMRP
jgi:hypothetical protein